MIKQEQSFVFSPLIVGTMRLGKWGADLSTNELESFLESCLSAGLKDFDHADIYGDYTSEADFGQVLKRRPDLRQQMQITTKCGIKLVSGNRSQHKIKSYDLTKDHIIASVENSLMCLHTDYIDLLLLHRPDYLMDPREIADAFLLLRQEGKVRFFGVSNFSPSQFDLINTSTPLITNQIEASLLHLEPFDDGTLDQCLRLGIRPTAWSPLGGGTIFKKSHHDARIKRVINAVKALAGERGTTPDQIMLAWLIKHPSRIIPVVGTSKFERIESALAATRLELSHEEWYMLLQASTDEEVP